MEYIDYLECVLENLNKNYLKGLNIDNIKFFYNKNSNNKIDNDQQRHFEHLYENKYIIRNGNSRIYRIKPDIKIILDQYGSLSAYLDILEKERIVKEDDNFKIRKLHQKNLELQNENLEYLQTIREKENVIRQLELKTKTIELVKHYWWFIGICISFGFVVKKIVDFIIN